MQYPWVKHKVFLLLTLWLGVYVIIFALKFLYVPWHTSGLCQIAHVLTTPRYIQEL